MATKKIYKCIECNHIGHPEFKLHGSWYVLLSLSFTVLVLVLSFPLIGILLGIGLYIYFRKPHCSACRSILVEPIFERDGELGLKAINTRLSNVENYQKENFEDDLMVELEVKPRRGVLIDWDFLLSGMSERQLKYNQLRGKFVNRSDSAALSFEGDYEREIKNLDQLVEKSTSLAVPYILMAVDDAVQILMTMGIYDIDRELFLREYYLPHDCWFNVFDSIADKYAEIVCNAEQLDEYRAIRRQGRGQIIGGGFGVEGVVQGVVIAGAANLAIGAAHGIFNLIGKGVSNYEDSIKKKVIFSDPKTKKSLVEGLRCSVFSVHLSLLDVLKKYGNDSSCQAVGEELVDKSKRMLNNLKTANIDDEERLKILKQILLLNPYSEDAYSYAVEKFGDLDKKLESIAEFFFINLKSIKHNKILSQVDVASENAVKESIRIAQELRIYYESNSVDLLLADLRKKLVAYDVQARTVSGKLYSTRGMAELAVKKLKKEKEDRLRSVVSTSRRLIVGLVKGVVFVFAIIVIVSILISIFAPLEEKAPAISDPYKDNVG